ncbi:MAG: DNA-directed RNA polymerase subunit H [Candidatus Diapherotrites archaeon]
MVLNKVSEHVLVPKHELIPQDKISEVLQKFGTELDKLPQILSDDAIAQELAAKKGDMIKITRKSPTAGKSIYYRIVV